MAPAKPKAKGKAEAKPSKALDPNVKLSDILEELLGDSDEEEADCFTVEQRRGMNRMDLPLTGMGLFDWAFNTPSVVDAFVQTFKARSEGMQHMLKSLNDAAELLNDEDWKRFIELPSSRIHRSDDEILTQLFPRIDKQWANMLKGKGDRTFLHVGTQAPTTQLCESLCKVGWYGVVVAPEEPPPGFEELIQGVKLDPSNDKESEMWKGMLHKSGGLIPKPLQFPLIFANVVFEKKATDPDTDDEDGAAAGLGGIREEERAESEASFRMDELAATALSGFGLLGATRSEQIRKRMVATCRVMALSIRRLRNDGVFVFVWPGLPCHPVLLFITACLRKVFLKVHVVTQEGTGSFEVWVLCIGFDRQKTEDLDNPDGGPLQSFIKSSYRNGCIDDVLLWTLSKEAEQEEAITGMGGKGSTGVKGYDELCYQFSVKYQLLADELAFDPTAMAKARAAQPKVKVVKDGNEKKEKKEKKAKKEKKEKKNKEPKEMEKVAAARDEPFEKAAEEKKVSKKKEKEEPPPEPEEVDEEEEEEAPPEAAKEPEKPAVVEKPKPAVVEKKPEKKKPKKRLAPLIVHINRSLPSLSCSLGACPGGDDPAGPSIQVLARTSGSTFISHGLGVAEKRIPVRLRRLNPRRRSASPPEELAEADPDADPEADDVADADPGLAIADDADLMGKTV